MALSKAGGDVRFFGERRLPALAAGLHGRDAAAVAEEVADAAFGHQHGVPGDDIAVVGVLALRRATR